MNISVQEIKEMLDKGEKINLVDVRTKPEYHSERIDSGDLWHHPLDDIEDINSDKSETLYLVCQTGDRSEKAQERLFNLGYENVIRVNGGLNAWKAGNLPTTKTKGTFPIMRQVMIAAGSLVLVGALGSVLVDPTWVWLAAFVGAGLTVAGLTGFCGMALMLSKMPWNKNMQG